MSERGDPKQTDNFFCGQTVARSADHRWGRRGLTKFSLSLFLCCGLCWFCGSGSVLAQQNLFNVPSGEITHEGNTFFQQQFNFSTVGQSNTTFEYGLGHGWEIGFNAFDINIYNSPTSPPIGRHQVNPDMLFNVQKGVEISDWWKIEFGSLSGFNLSSQPEDIRFQTFNFTSSCFTLPDEVAKFYLGAYQTNVAYAGPGNCVGFLIGTEIPVVKDKFHFMADYISGTNDISVGVIGGVWYLPSKWQVSLGAQVPAPHSHNAYGVVLELTRP